MKKMNFNSNTILKQKFATELAGYSPFEVDQYLDKIIEDYLNFNTQIDELNQQLVQKEEKIRKSEDEISKLKLANQNLKSQLDMIHDNFKK